MGNTGSTGRAFRALTGPALLAVDAHAGSSFRGVSLLRLPRSHNERMLEVGWVTPYFIWPNIDPFRRQGSLIDAVLEPGTANTVAEQAGALKVARGFVRDAREQHLGLFEQADPLRLLPF
jgi:hypothetical protein